MKKIKKESIKPFILGIITTIVVIILIALADHLITKIKTRRQIEENNIIENQNIPTGENEAQKVNIDGINYEIQEFKDNTVCDEANDIMYYCFYRYFVKNNGDIYLMSDKKYSDTNQNCKKLDTNIKIKNVVGSTIIDTNNKAYYIDWDIDKYVLKSSDIKIEKELLENDIKYVTEYYSYTDYDSHKAAKEYLVLKDDGKIYHYKYEAYYSNATFDFIYNLKEQNIFIEFENEKIKKFSINKDCNYNYIVTDKAAYISIIKNKECEEYNDIKCEYDYARDSVLSKYKDEIISVDEFTKVKEKYGIRTHDKTINVQKVN